MGKSPRLITDALYEEIKSAYQDIDKISRRAIRLRALLTAKEHSVGFAAEAFGLSRATLQHWTNRFIEEGLEGLDYKPGRGRKGHLQQEHRNALKCWLEEEPNLTLKELVIKLEEVFAVQTSVPAVHRALRDLDLSYITPRPIHHKQDKASQENFKKKSETDTK